MSTSHSMSADTTNCTEIRPGNVQLLSPIRVAIRVLLRRILDVDVVVRDFPLVLADKAEECVVVRMAARHARHFLCACRVRGSGGVVVVLALLSGGRDERYFGGRVAVPCVSLSVGFRGRHVDCFGEEGVKHTAPPRRENGNPYTRQANHRC